MHAEDTAGSNETQPTATPSNANPGRLSARERQVLEAFCEDLQPHQAAERLGLNIKTVSTYRARILQKTGCKNNVQLGMWAVRNGVAGEGC